MSNSMAGGSSSSGRALTPLGDLNTAGSSNAGRGRSNNSDSSQRYTEVSSSRSKHSARSASTRRRQRLRSTAASAENSDPVGSALALATVILPLAKEFLDDVGAQLAAAVSVHRQSQGGGDSESDGDDGTIWELIKTKELPPGGGGKRQKAFLARFKVIMLGFVQEARGKLPAAIECWLEVAEDIFSLQLHQRRSGCRIR